MEDPIGEPYNVRAITMTGSKQNDDQSIRSQYSMPGILHFLQTEWTRYESDRIQWEVDRAELQTKVAFLQGERKAQENLKRDLVRRIKMLEFALRQERSKFHHLKYGTDLDSADMIPPSLAIDNKDQQVVPSVDSIPTTNNNMGFYKQGHQLLRQYLQEIGYTDTIIDVRSARIRQMLGLPARDNKDDLPSNPVKGDLISGKRPIETQGSRANVKKIPQSLVDSAPLSSEESVMTNFDFLSCENGDEPFVDNDDNENENGSVEYKNDEQVHISKKKVKVSNADDVPSDMDDVMADIETEDALAEFDFLVSESNDRLGREQNHQNNADLSDNGNLSPNEDWQVDQQLMNKMKERRHEGRASSGSTRPSRSALKAMLVNLDSDMDSPALQSGLHSPPNHSDADEVPHKGLMGILGENSSLEGSLGLGELADLNVNNEGDSPISDVLDSSDFHRKAWTAKYTLRSHFDAIRAVVFHPVEPILLTAGEDEVVKMWNLQKAMPGKKASTVDLEPVCTFRAHGGPVLCLAMIANGKMCLSGGTDGTICCWNLPNPNSEVYDAYDGSILHSQLRVHTDAVWGLSVQGSKLLSCSADGTVRLWSTDNSITVLQTFKVDTESGVPTSVDFVRSEPDQMVVSYSSSKAYIFDIEKAQPIMTLDCTPISGNGQINRIITHPTLPITIAAHDDRYLRFFDNNTGKVVHSMVAHLDTITSLALDPSGLYLLSGSHDCSMRLWNLETKTCIQEITAHRKKFDESIHDVAFHPAKPFIASVGADGVAKVFV